MLKVLIVALLTFIGLGIQTAAYAGPCQHSWQTASDGSNCGARSADDRPGGG
jgi:hypothetical protein